MPIDAKGIYYGPQESGLATVLPPSRIPAIMGKMGDAAMRAEAAKNTRRQRAVSEAFNALTKPFKTYEYYQKYTSDKVNSAVQELSRLSKLGNESDIRAFTASSVQELTNIKVNADAIGEYFVNMGKTLNKAGVNKVIDIPELQRRMMAKNLIDEEGNKISPAEVDITTWDIDDFILKSDKGHELINTTEAISAALNSVVGKEWIRLEESSYVEKTRSQGVSGGAQHITPTVSAKVNALSALDPATQTVKLLDIDKLQGAYTFFMNDKYIQKAIEGEAVKTPGFSEMDEDAKDRVRAVALRDNLAKMFPERKATREEKSVVKGYPTMGVTEKKDKDLRSHAELFAGYIRSNTPASRQKVNSFLGQLDVSAKTDKLKSYLSGLTQLDFWDTMNIIHKFEVKEDGELHVTYSSLDEDRVTKQVDLSEGNLRGLYAVLYKEFNPYAHVDE